MAKKTKSADLSIEEKLEQALIVPGYEPYKIPDNWCWTTVGTVTNIYRGVSYKKNEGHSEKHMNDCLVLRGGNIQEGSIDTETDNVFVNRDLVSGTQIIRKYDVIIVSSTGSKKVIGRAGISFSDYSDVAFGAFLTLVRANDYIYKPFIAYYLQSDIYRNRIRTLASGVNINNIRNEYITETPLSLPPLPEQQRIVERIESLFSKLDEAKEKAQEVIDSFEIRKAAILHKAFSGELTAKWREKNEGESWENIPLAEFATIVSGFAFSSNDFNKQNGVPCVKITNVGVGEYYADEYEYLPDAYLNEYPQFVVNYGDVLISLTRSYINTGLKVCIYLEPKKALLNQRVALIKNCNTQYLYYYLCSNSVLTYIKEKSKTTNQPNLSIKDLRNLIIPVASSEEQQIIVEELDSLLSKEIISKQAAEALIDQIDIMKKSILSRAFRGELGTNDPEEGSAVELLKEILSGNNNKEESKKQKRTRIVIPKEIDSLLKTELERKIIKLFLKSSTGELTAEEIMAVSSKKFDILNTIRILQKQHLIIKSGNKNYTKYTLVR